MSHVDASNTAGTAPPTLPELPSKRKPMKRPSADTSYFSDATLKANRAGKLTAEQKKRLTIIYLRGVIGLFFASLILGGFSAMLILPTGFIFVEELPASIEGLGMVGTGMMFALVTFLMIAVTVASFSSFALRVWYLIRLYTNGGDVKQVTGRITRYETRAVVDKEILYMRTPIELSLQSLFNRYDIKDFRNTRLLRANGDYHVYFVPHIRLLLSAESAYDELSILERRERFYRQKQAHINQLLDITADDLRANRKGKLSERQRKHAYIWQDSNIVLGLWLSIGLTLMGIYATIYAFSASSWEEFVANDGISLLCVVPAFMFFALFGLFLIGQVWEYIQVIRAGKIISYRGKLRHEIWDGSKSKSYYIKVGNSETIEVRNEDAQAAFIEGLTYVIYVLPRTKTLVGAEVIPPQNL